MMDFRDEPDRDRLLAMHELLSLWGQESQPRRRPYMSNTYVIMRWLEDHAKKHVKRMSLPSDLTPHSINRPYVNKLVDQVDAALSRDKWIGHEDDRRAIIIYYYAFLYARLGRVARELDCKPWEVEARMMKALRHFVLVY